jgi:hypothetical protein
MHMQTLRRTLCLAAVVLLASIGALAQFSQRGSISGVVTEASGAIVPKGSVTLHDLDRNQTSTTNTDGNGHYEFSQLLPGNYQISVEVSGFKKAVSESLAVSPQSAVRYDCQLQLGAVSEQVEVTTAAPLLQTESADLDQNISQEEIASVPMNGRNWTSLTELTPGVSTSPRNNINLGGTFEVGASYTSGGADYTAGGNTEGSRDNGYYINGVNANENYESGSSFQPSAEAIGEVRVGIADFSAEYGRDFTNLNATTKSGSNSFHGEVYDFFENDALNALVPINKAQGLFTKSAYRFNEYGGGLGGPIYIPKVLDLKNRAFFFVNYERNPHSLAGPNNLAIVPSNAQLAGDFGADCTGPINQGTFDPSGLCSVPNGQIYNPYTQAAVPFNNLVSAGLFNPATENPTIKGIGALFPQANLTPTVDNNGANYQYSSKQAVDPYHWDSRFDYRISSKDNVFVAWSQYSGIPNNTGGLNPGFVSNVSDKSHVVTIDESHVFSSHLTNEFIFAIGSGALQTLSPSEVAFANSDSNPFNSIFLNTGTSANKGIMGLNIFNYGPLFSQPSLGYEEYFLASNNSRQFSDNLNWIHGSHSMTFGFNYLRKAEEDFDNVRYVAFGCAPYSGGYCGAGPQFFTGNQGAGVGGDAYADVLLGLPSVIHQRYDYSSGGAFAPEPNAIIPYYGLYFNDKWKASQKLTVSYGLRYDLPIPIFATNNACCAVYQPSTDTLAIPGIAPGLPQHYATAPKHDFAPRLSLAMQLRPTLVVRAGYGLYYNSGASQISNLLSGALYGGVPGGFVGDEIDNSPSNPQGASINQVFPTSPQVAPGTYPSSTGTGQGYYGDGQEQTVFYADRNQSFRTPYVHRYLLDVQQQVSHNSVITFSYIGAEGRNGWYFDDINAAPYKTGWASIEDYNAARPFNSGRFGDIYLQRAGLNSNYNAGIVKFEHQMGHGVQILTHYTYSKILGDRGIIGQGTQDAGYNYSQGVIRSYGEETGSHRHRFLFETNYQPKYADRLPSYLRPALGDWHISAIATMESGDALTVYNGENQANDYAPANGLGNLNMIHNPNLAHGDRSYSEYFDTSAFVVPPTNVQGTAAPGVVRGPGQNNWDIAFGKNINFFERLHAEIRADMYNAFNHTQWNAISTQLNGSTGPFGQVTGSREGRIIQIATKIVF